MPLTSLQAIAQPIEQAKTAAEVIAALDSFTNTVLPVVGVRAGPDDLTFNPALPAKVPLEFAHAFELHGPSVMARHSALNPPPFTFTEAMRRLQPTGDDRWIFELFRAHAIRDGLYCPYGPWNVVYAAYQPLTQTSLPEKTRLALDAAGAMAVHRLKELAGRTMTNAVDLSPREKSVLLHLSDGLSTGQIAHRLNLAEGSVKTFTRRATKKLGAKSQLHAVALALRQHLI